MVLGPEDEITFEVNYTSSDDYHTPALSPPHSVVDDQQEDEDDFPMIYHANINFSGEEEGELDYPVWNSKPTQPNEIWEEGLNGNNPKAFRRRYGEPELFENRNEPVQAAGWGEEFDETDKLVGQPEHIPVCQNKEIPPLNT